ETQNLTRGELKKVLTRISDDCTVIMIGHHGQIDLPKERSSGFVPYIEHFKDEDYCEVVTLTRNFRGRLAQHADKLKWEIINRKGDDFISLVEQTPKALGVGTA